MQLLLMLCPGQCTRLKNRAAHLSDMSFKRCCDSLTIGCINRRLLQWPQYRLHHSSVEAPLHASTVSASLLCERSAVVRLICHRCCLVARQAASGDSRQHASSVVLVALRLCWCICPASTQRRRMRLAFSTATVQRSLWSQIQTGQSVTVGGGAHDGIVAMQLIGGDTIMMEWTQPCAAAVACHACSCMSRTDASSCVLLHLADWHHWLCEGCCPGCCRPQHLRSCVCWWRLIS